jgi:hypothetical protein
MAWGIEKWLEETVAAGNADAPVEGATDEQKNTLYSKKSFSDGRRLRKRKRATPDSSIIEQMPDDRKSRSQILETTVVSHEDETIMRRTVLRRGYSPNNKSSQKYKRQPRRKTRIDKYDCHEYSRNVEDNEQNRCKKKKRRRESQRKSRSFGAGIIRSFHANNVPKDRLTVFLSYEVMG